jgi:hypothetical protein
MAGVTRVGATKQYSDNWDNIFGGKRRTSAATPKSTKPTRQSAKKKSPKKNRTPKAAKKASRRK